MVKTVIVAYKITLKEKSAGKVLSFIEEYPIDDEDDEWVEFLWKEGTMSCDCNRERYFYPDIDSSEYKCGDERFELLSLEKVEDTK